MIWFDNGFLDDDDFDLILILEIFFLILHDIVKQNFIMTLSNDDFVIPLSNQ